MRRGSRTPRGQPHERDETGVRAQSDRTNSIGVATMMRTDNLNRPGVWFEEAMHRTANLRQLGTNLERLVDTARIDASDRSRTIRRANSLASAYQSLDKVD